MYAHLHCALQSQAKNYNDVDPITLERLADTRCLYSYSHPNTGDVYVYDGWAWLEMVVNQHKQEGTQPHHPVFRTNLTPDDNLNCYYTCKADYDRYPADQTEHKLHLLEICTSKQITKNVRKVGNQIVGIKLNTKSPVRWIEIVALQHKYAEEGSQVLDTPIHCTASIEFKICSSFHDEDDITSRIYI